MGPKEPRSTVLTREEEAWPSDVCELTPRQAAVPGRLYPRHLTWELNGLPWDCLLA